VQPEQKLVPLGIFEVCDDELTILFGTSHETSDFIVGSTTLRSANS
jgi:hypothetical protein